MTREEAQEEYENARSRYYSSAESLCRSRSEMENCRGDLDQARNDMATARSEKLNFEKRIKEIQKIIDSLEGKGGWFSANVPESVSKANDSSGKAGESMGSCIKCDGIPTPDFQAVFKCSSVEEDSHSSEALEAFRSEKNRLEEAVDNVQKKIDQLETDAENLTRQINALADQQRAIKKQMSNIVFDMCHYRKLAI